jgi:hypothetical protein
MQISFHFVPMGTVAPATLADNEIWFDVGNRAAPQVLDHHGGDTDAKSAAELVFNNYDEFILTPLSNKDEIVFVLHTNPDLDAICSAWLAQKFLIQGPIDTLNIIEKMILAVNENDQGLVKTDTPYRCWPIVMRTLLAVEYVNAGDQTLVDSGLDWMEETLDILCDGGSLEDAAEKLITPRVSNALQEAKSKYEEDMTRSQVFQIQLPQKVQSVQNNRSNLADALLLTDPQSILFKELARADKKNSPQGKGFPLLIVSRSIEEATDTPLFRYVISTDPLTGFHLKGLGRRLEALEQKKEERLGFPLLPGRERVAKGKGRHGYNVKSPWYDGRGHDYTIVDSPAVEINGKVFCASCLSVEQILEVLMSNLFKKGNGN